MRVRAFAKINRSLRIVGVRPDGYHELRTEFQSIALHDTLSLRATRGPFGLACDDPECPADATNLVRRAAVLAWAAAGRRGDTLEQLRDGRAAWVVLVIPGVGVSTADAYAWWDAADRSTRREPQGRPERLGTTRSGSPRATSKRGPGVGLDQRGNDLQPVV